MLESECEQLAAADEEFAAYWRAHKAKWETPMRLLDVNVAYRSGELNSILPNGQPSRVPSGEPLMTLGKAVELFDDGKVQVRRRFRNLQPVEWVPRWDRAVATRARLQAMGNWEMIALESEKAREYENAMVRGEMEKAEGSSGGIRMSVEAAGRKASANFQNQVDGGIRLAFAELLETAGETPEERLLSAVLLAEFKNEAEALTFEARLKAAAARAAEAKAAGIDPELAQKVYTAKKASNSRAMTLIGAAVFIGLALVAVGGVGSTDPLQSTLDLLQ
jgi:hypothetical protein